MTIHRQSILVWSIFVIASILLILLWIGKLDVQKNNIDGTVRGATILLRIANFVLTTEIFLVVSCVYGVFVWYIIHQNSISTTHADLWVFYDGGSTLLPTLKSIVTSKIFSLRALSIAASAVMIASYFLDVFYIQAISYNDVEQCEVGNTTIDIMSANSTAFSYINRYRKVYSMGSGIGLLPYSNIEYSSTYIVPALGNTTNLSNYTTVAYNVSTFCENAKTNISEATLYAESFSGDYDEVTAINDTKQISIIRMDSSDYDPLANSIAFYVLAYGFQNTTPTGMTSIKYGKYNATVARCRPTVTYGLYNNVYGWEHDINYTSADGMASGAQAAPYNLEDVYTQTIASETHNKVTEWLTNCKTTYNDSGYPQFQSNISLADYERKLTMIMVQYLKGGGLNGTTTTLGLYCMPRAHQSSVAKWYKIIYSCAQGVIFVVLVLYTLISSKQQQIENNTDTLLKFNAISL